MEGDLILIIIIAVYLRSFFKAERIITKWRQILLWAIYVAVFLMFFGKVTTISEKIIEWIAQLVLVGFMILMVKDKTFIKARSLLTALLPYIAVSFLANLVQLISPSLYKKWDTLLGTAEVFAFIWAIGSGFIIRRQRKALAKERKQREEEEAQNRIVRSMKDELEVQVAERTAELTQQKEELQTALHELKAAQAQLIQNEKMASLGELTAGIAHEIQNPLNFVNNFSELNAELINELKTEIEKGNYEEVKFIADDLTENEKKIAYHGKRADAIVKGMLQHSRKNTGQKELTDLNALCDEYLRLSFHGLRAKDKSFNADFKTDFDESIGKINIVPQDMGRALLNLINNAFYAVDEKKKNLSGLENYKPLVSITTRKINSPSSDEAIEIKVSDNGNGIPQNIIDKIFQPFFTTKPTGQGTGLGLSLTYDIVTKEHNGTIKVESEEGEGSEFIISLPVKLLA